MRHSMNVWSSEGGYGGFSNESEFEEIMAPDAPHHVQLTPLDLDAVPTDRSVLEESGDDVVLDETGLDGSEAGPDNPARGLD